MDAATASGSDPNPASAVKPTWEDLKRHLEPALSAVGLDILHPFCVQRLNDSCPSNGAVQPLPIYGHDATLALLIGNSRAIWRPFIAWLAAEKGRAKLPDPLDTYVEAAVATALASCPALFGVAHHIRHSHDTGDRFVNIARAAQLSGLAYYSTATHLCWHPVYGPWFALRAVVVVDAPCDAAIAQQQLLACPHLDLEAAGAEQMAKLLQLPGGRDGWRAHWREWAGLREIGDKYTDARYRYSHQQLAYHYTKDTSILHGEVEASTQQS